MGGDHHHHQDGSMARGAGGDDGPQQAHDMVMPGFRFHPTEEELIDFYLRRRVEGKRFNIELINLVDLYRYDPWDLPALASIGDKEWFFYVPRDRKYRNGDRPNRVTPSGYWKATGADRMVRVEGNRSIGLKKTLVFYVGKAPKGLRSSWIMNEYRLPHGEADRYQKEDEHGRRLDDDEIIDILIMYLNAGHESSGHITMWATVFLQENPDIFAKAKAEQEAIMRSIPANQQGLTLRDFRKMQYLSQVIDETLRFVNISFVSFRQATKDVIVNGYLIPKGWKVQLWYRSVHMDPEVYPDPKKFNPSRWEGHSPRAGTFLAFGLGARLCPGNDLAKLEISVFLHHFLLGYRLTRTNPNCRVRYLPHPRPVDNCLAKITKVSDDY